MTVLTLMTGLLLALCQDGRRITLKYRDGAQETVTVLKHDARGMMVHMDGIDYDVWIDFGDLDPRTVTATRQMLTGTTRPVPARRGLMVMGVRITLDDGVVEGLELPTSDAVEVRIKTSQGTRVIPRVDIRGMERVDVDMRLIYSPEEIYRKLFERFRPNKVEDWDSLGRELNRAGLGDRALQVFRIVTILKRPQVPEYGLYQSLGRLYLVLVDLTAREAVGRMQEASFVGDFDSALERVREVERILRVAQGGRRALEELLRVKTEIVVLRRLSTEGRLQSEWQSTIDALLMRIATDGAQGFAEADLYVRKRLMEDAEKRVADRLHFTPGDPVVADAWRRRPARQRLIHSYGSATVLLGRSSPNASEDWWSRAAPEDRMAYLKGLHVELHRTVLREDAKNCPTCGARGSIRGSTPNSTITCPSCFGAQKYRVLVYR